MEFGHCTISLNHIFPAASKSTSIFLVLLFKLKAHLELDFHFYRNGFSHFWSWGSHMKTSRAPDVTEADWSFSFSILFLHLSQLWIDDFPPTFLSPPSAADTISSRFWHVSFWL